jgi:16S rRNA (uracil1498-N3)-methyltransferase
VPHFFGERSGDRVYIRGADARHLARSLRARPGEAVLVVQPEGRLLLVRLLSVGDAMAEGVVESEREHRPEPAAKITMALAMLPAAALEEALARCTELGAFEFVLVQAERSVARGAKPERWAAICREAAMLAGRLRVPDVVAPRPFAAAWRGAHEPWLLDGDAEARLFDAAEPRDLTLFIGPEGGWSDRERELAGDRRVSLGPRNLRAQNAAAAALTVALAARGDL